MLGTYRLNVIDRFIYGLLLAKRNANRSPRFTGEVALPSGDDSETAWGHLGISLKRSF